MTPDKQVDGKRPFLVEPCPEIKYTKWYNVLGFLIKLEVLPAYTLVADYMSFSFRVDDNNILLCIGAGD